MPCDGAVAYVPCRSVSAEAEVIGVVVAVVAVKREQRPWLV